MSTPEQNPSEAKSVDSKERLIVLDVLRGFALLGVLLVNLPFAALPSEQALEPLGDLVPWALVKAFGETKFVSLFSLLFGIGLVLQLDRAKARGASTGFYLRRLLILGVIGLLHGLLLWFGDILLPYAVAGFILYLLRRKSPKTLTVLAVPLFLIGIVLSTGMVLLESLEPGGGDGSELSALFGSDESWNELEARAWTEGPLGLTMSVRAVEYAGWLVISSLISFNWHVMALFLIGAALMKRGFLNADHRRAHGRLALVGIVAGLLLESAAIAIWISSDFAPGLLSAAATLLHEVGSLVLAAGYLGAVLFIVHGGGWRFAHAPLAAVGRTALTSYLGQSVAFNLLFPWYGLGLWGELDRAQILGLGFAVYAVQVVIALLWLRWFAMGPCEWVWRWLSYGRRPALLLR